ncbi:hypothetical protein ACFU6S_30330 [Streptomyces sp. NPDC057456]|uniref:hypothetical protein n=1 Tax=Streptomyces sp. NPDC057456 TaxID=3346139 RepID=UPI0036A26DCA
MTTDAGLPSVRESLQLAHLAEPEASPLVAELAADHYHLNYSKHPVPVLFRKVRAPRTLLAGVLPASTDGTELHRQLGRLSKLLGNLAFHWRLVLLVRCPARAGGEEVPSVTP